MKILIRLISFALLFAVLVTAASAELKRGDKGEEVNHIQTMLFQTGFLFAEPDGDFGRQTENAVKKFQEVMELPITGIIGDYDLEVLNQLWYDCMKDMGIDIQTEADDADYPAECYTDFSEKAYGEQVAYCARHHSMAELTMNAIGEDSFAASHEIRTMWLEEVSRLYAVWADMVNKEEIGAVTASYAAFLSDINMQESAMRVLYGIDKDIESVPIENCIAELLRRRAIWLCGILAPMD